MPKIHKTKGKPIIKYIRYRFIPYDELCEVLKSDGEAFLESNGERPFKRSTMWKAAKKLSKMVGKTVRAERALLRVDGVDYLEGYSFSIEQPSESQNR
jgi:hypothetical protein